MSTASSLWCLLIGHVRHKGKHTDDDGYVWNVTRCRRCKKIFARWVGQQP